MDSDMNRYDLNHVTTDHASMSRKEWERVYHMAWDAYYTPEHVETVFKRAHASGMSVGKMMFLMLWFYGCYKFEGLHPLEGGYFRRKYRLDRRPGLRIENPFIFYPRRIWDTTIGHAKVLSLLWQYGRIRKRVKADVKGKGYSDIALSPVTEVKNDNDSLELLAKRQKVAAVSV